MSTSAQMKLTRTLSAYKQVAFFSSEFSVLPSKINEYLRADSPSNANTWKTNSLCKYLYIINLHPRIISPSHEMHHFSMRYGPFRVLIRTISHPDTGINGG